MIKKINCWEGKKYQLVTSDNYDAYMKELGMGLVQRKLGNTKKPIVMLHKIESTHNLITVIDDQPTVLTFKLGKEFDEETYDLRNMKTTFNLYDNTLVQEQKGVVCTKITREFHLNKMMEQSVINNVAARRVFHVLGEDESKDLTELLEKLENEQQEKKEEDKEAKQKSEAKREVERVVNQLVE
uniref:Myelin P2 protein n=1 Tax=Bactrocera latifrons TaxID=174628 RepID=A0A0K8U6L0_BACLA